MAQQQMYQQQQQPPQNWHLQQQQQQPQQQPPQPPSNVGFMPQQPGVNNPYAKPPNANALLHRPSSTTIYQQGYK
jgi:hypothetical protein